MSIGALAALPIIGDAAKAVGEVTKAVAPLAQPFADVLAKALGNALDSQNKSLDFSSTQETAKRTLTF
ncbi:hypothetical protein EXW72_18380 [Pseudomonas sp. BCA14]|uniref:hypothetical protein n=1 Tax=unclassified Pseudomonas TaxID=196821 RepID=UPI00106E1A27|nr:MULTISPECIES: hypothetical protein [unclassified Pseudomonas]TFF06063.1 hypothetical protein EXW70_19610 [Pseudomonas sp. JMN1]TFF08316.1 hypothetical protein EXW71_20210 [Pseudomonas sp. BCA17]TFF23770.1 hypothetical protein EXW72_18380 [Pseudomonas sp. BCA14]TFF28020.1 hypothetical protein EXW73_11380 [Pseudomonas sp. BCA13]